MVELSTYDGGLKNGVLSSGGTPNTRDWNIYELDVDDPPQTYYLNSGQSGLYVVFVISYAFNIAIKNGSTLTLRADSIDGREITNDAQKSVQDSIPAHPIAVKQPYPGQFIQIDAISLN